MKKKLLTTLSCTKTSKLFRTLPCVQVFIESISVGVLYPVGTFANPEVAASEALQVNSNKSTTHGSGNTSSSSTRSFESYLSVSVGDLCSLVRRQPDDDGKSDKKGTSFFMCFHIFVSVFVYMLFGNVGVSRNKNNSCFAVLLSHMLLFGISW